MIDMTVRPSSRRGTTNTNARGNTRNRLARRLWLITTFRANVTLDDLPACRELLSISTVTIDRIVPGCQGGTYRRNNIRPACGPCNTLTGASTRKKS